MKGKIAFVLGAAVGYVLGSRAGRARYEQIKRGADKVWSSTPVQRGVSLVREAVDDRADEVMAFVRRASADAYSSYVNKAEQKSREKRAEKASANTAPGSKDTRPSGKATVSSDADSTDAGATQAEGES